MLRKHDWLCDEAQVSFGDHDPITNVRFYLDLEILGKKRGRKAYEQQNAFINNRS